MIKWIIVVNRDWSFECKLSTRCLLDSPVKEPILDINLYHTHWICSIFSLHSFGLIRWQPPDYHQIWWMLNLSFRTKSKVSKVERERDSEKKAFACDNTELNIIMRSVIIERKTQQRWNKQQQKNRGKFVWFVLCVRIFFFSQFLSSHLVFVACFTCYVSMLVSLFSVSRFSHSRLAHSRGVCVWMLFILYTFFVCFI